MAKGAAALSRWQQTAYRYLATMPEEQRQLGRHLIQVGAELRHRRAILGAATQRDLMLPTPRAAMLQRDQILGALINDYERVRSLSCTVGGTHHGERLSADDFMILFRTLSLARVYFWEPEIHRAALSGAEQFDGTPFP